MPASHRRQGAKAPQFVLAQLEQMPQNGEENAQDGAQRYALVGGIRAALYQRTEESISVRSGRIG